MLLWRGEPSGPPRRIIALWLVERHLSDSEINKMRTVRSEHHVTRGNIRVDYPVRMELGRGLA